MAAEIIPARPPTIAIMTAMANDAYKPTFGSTPAMIEKAIASGINANATTIPAKISLRTLPSQSCLADSSIILCSFLTWLSLN